QPETVDGVAWSPNGKKITFVSRRDGNPEIYVMNADGTRPVRLTNNPAKDVFPAWSPDGLHIIFASLRDDPKASQHWQIYVMNADGSHLKSLTGDVANSYAYARWSPDGRRIAETEVHDAKDASNIGGINIISLTGEGKMQLPYAGTYDSASWSP